MNILFLNASVLFLLIFQKQAGEGLFKGIGGRRAGILFFNFLYILIKIHKKTAYQIRIGFS